MSWLSSIGGKVGSALGIRNIGDVVKVATSPIPIVGGVVRSTVDNIRAAKAGQPAPNPSISDSIRAAVEQYGNDLATKAANAKTVLTTAQNIDQGVGAAATWLKNPVTWLGLGAVYLIARGRR